MNFDNLSEPLSEDSPVGEDCAPEIQSANFDLMVEYLVERALQRGRERVADQSGLAEAEALNAAALRDDGKRRLASLEGILKDVLRTSAINIEQVAKVLREKASNLLAHRGKDLRLLPPLGAACACTEGLSGYAATIALALKLLQAYPVELYPRPDEDDPTDLWERVNAVTELVSGAGMQALLGPAVVVDSRQMGRITLADLVGGLHPEVEADEVSDQNLFAALSSLEPEAVEQLLARLRDTESAINDLVLCFDGGNRPKSRLGEAIARAAQRIEAVSSGDGSASTRADDAAAGPGTPARSAGPRNATGLQSREDACRAIEEVIRFIQSAEPAHPAPLLLKRANRLLRMNFLDIINDMAPNAMDQILGIVGTEPTE